MATSVNVAPATALSEQGRHALAAVAIVPILATVYQTLVLTDVTDDVIRKGIEGEHYTMLWTSATWGAAVVYGLFGGIWGMAHYGGRQTLQVGLVLFGLGNLLCGAAVDVTSLAAAKAVEGVGKGMVISLCRALLYRQFDKAILVAIGFYAVVAYASRPATPLVTALINDAVGWRWIFWVNVPVAVVGLILVDRFIRPDRPAKPLPLRLDWVAITLMAAWAVSLLFVCGWYRKWGGWSSNAFAVTALLAVVLPAALAIWVGAGFSRDEHLRRMLRVRAYVCAMCIRMLLLLNLGIVMTVIAKYLVALRDYPREMAGWLLVPATLTMAFSTVSTICFQRRAWRHVWLLIGVLGTAGCSWWLASVDNFTSREQIALMVGCWGLMVGLLPPVFLTDEVEALDRRDALYGGALAVACLVIPLIIVPTMASTVISAWGDRALDAERVNLSDNRPEVQAASARLADYYRGLGLQGPELSQWTSTALGAFVQKEAVAHGIQSGFRFLSLVVGGIGLLVTLLLFLFPPRPAPGSGVTR